MTTSGPAGARAVGEDALRGDVDGEVGLAVAVVVARGRDALAHPGDAEGEDLVGPAAGRADGEGSDRGEIDREVVLARPGVIADGRDVLAGAGDPEGLDDVGAAGGPVGVGAIGGEIGADLGVAGAGVVADGGDRLAGSRDPEGDEDVGPAGAGPVGELADAREVDGEVGLAVAVEVVRGLRVGRGDRGGDGHDLGDRVGQDRRVVAVVVEGVAHRAGDGRPDDDGEDDGARPRRGTTR